MGIVVDEFANTFGDFTVPGLPASGLKNVAKADARRLGFILEAALAAASGNLGRYETLADRDAATKVEGMIAYVYRNNDDPEDPENGFYQVANNAWEPATWYGQAAAEGAANLVTEPALALIAAAAQSSAATVAQVFGAGDFASNADALSNGVASVTITAAGTGATDGTYAWTTTGGAGSGASGWLIISGGAVTKVQVEARGKGYTTASPSSLAITGSPGGSGRTLTLVLSQNRPAGTYWRLRVTGGFELFENVAGAATSRGVYPDKTSLDSTTALATALAAYRAQLDAEVLTYEVSDNLYNPATRVVDKYIDGAGLIATATPGSGWSHVMVPVTPGTSITVSANASLRVGSAFYTSAGALIPGSYSAVTSNPVTRVVPDGAAYLGRNLSSNSVALPSQIMINLGAAALPYSAWHAPIARLKASAIDQDVPEALKDYELEVVSPNLFDVTQRRDGKYLDNSGLVASATGWSMSGFIPVERNKPYILSGVRGRQGLAFYSAMTDTALIAGTYTSVGSLPLSVTSPDVSGPIYAVFNLASSSSPTYSDVQFEQGEVPTPYTPPGEVRRVDRDSIYPPLSNSEATLRLASGDGASLLSFPMDGQTFMWRFSPFRTLLHTTSALFQLFSYSLGGVTRSDNAGDDIAPYRVFGGTIGAGHGYRQTQCTVAGHGKTRVDVGSIWTDGVDEWVINDVPSTSTICVTKRYGNAYFTGATLTHVSGAAHAEAFTPTAKTNVQWYPAHQNRVLSVAVDDAEVIGLNLTLAPERTVSVSERYDILDKDSLVAWLTTQVGTATDITAYQGTSAISVANHHVMDLHGVIVGHHDFVALQDASAFQDIMFIQAYRLKPGNGSVEYLIPGTLPLTHEGADYDFTQWTDMTAWAPATRLDITPDRIADADIWPDRVIMRDDDLCLAIGYLPILDAAPDVRPANAARKALQISEIAKVYMACIDTDARSSLAAGDHFQAVTYRAAFPRPTGRETGYAVRSPYGDFFFVDWSANVIDRVPLPPDLRGRPFEIVRAVNVTVLSEAATDSLICDVRGASGLASLVVRFG